MDKFLKSRVVLYLMFIALNFINYKVFGFDVAVLLGLAYIMGDIEYHASKNNE